MKLRRLLSLRGLAIVFILAVSVFWVWAFSPWARGAHPDTLITTDANAEFVAEAEILCAGFFPDGEWAKGREIAGLNAAQGRTVSELSQERAVYAREAEEIMDDMVAELKQLASRYFSDWENAGLSVAEANGQEVVGSPTAKSSGESNAESSGGSSVGSSGGTSVGNSGETSDAELIRKWFVDWDGYIADHKAWATKLETIGDEELVFDSIDGARPRGRIEIFTRVNRMPACAIPNFV